MSNADISYVAGDDPARKMAGDKIEILEAEIERLKKEIIKPLLEGYCNMSQMINPCMPFDGDPLTDAADQVLTAQSNKEVNDEQ